MKNIKYQMVPISTMTKQISLRLSDRLLKAAKKKAEKLGFTSVQGYIEETLREKLFGDDLMSFVQAAQRKAMKEIWDNDEDEAWENA